MSDLLHARFDRIRHDAEGDWQDVVQRVNGRRRRRRLTVVGAIGAVVALGAPTALGLRGQIVNFFQSEPAPRRLVLDFARMDVGAPPGLENHVLYGQTRKIFERTLENGQTFTLWVAPSKRGGFCRAWVGPRMAGGFGCLWGRLPIAPGYSVRGISRDGAIERGPVLVEGSVAIDQAEAVELQYEDGDADRQALTWVSKPISAAFFLFDVPEQHWSKGHRFDRLVVRDAEGRELHSEPFSFRGPPRMDPKTGAPSDARQEQARKLISVRTHTVIEAALWTAPAANGGGTCQWLRLGASGFGGGCSARGIERPVLVVGRSQGGGVVLLSGGPARADMAEVAVRYEEGDGAVVPVIKGMWLYKRSPSSRR